MNATRDLPPLTWITRTMKRDDLSWPAALRRLRARMQVMRSKDRLQAYFDRATAQQIPVHLTRGVP